jgi:HD-GYP domain-containing protein (c-di-GMP phosphodiesterase class II)
VAERVHHIHHLRQGSIEHAFRQFFKQDQWILSRLDEMSPELRDHHINTAYGAMRLTEFQGLPSYLVIRATQAGLLHDHGKLQLPPDVVNKRGELSPDEWVIMRKHAAIGARPLFQHDEIVAEIVEAHGESFSIIPPEDLNGQLPLYLAKRSHALADQVDALMSERCYKPAWTAADTRIELRAKAQFPDDLIDFAIVTRQEVVR